jgi:hypothetical protein
MVAYDRLAYQTYLLKFNDEYHMALDYDVAISKISLLLSRLCNPTLPDLFKHPLRLFFYFLLN